MDKEVYFDQYCVDCKHKNESEDSVACNECLYNPCDDDSHKPVNYVKDGT